jgi:hypothetical protein
MSIEHSMKCLNRKPFRKRGYIGFRQDPRIERPPQADCDVLLKLRAKAARSLSEAAVQNGDQKDNVRNCARTGVSPCSCDDRLGYDERRHTHNPPASRPGNYQHRRGNHGEPGR